MSTIFRPYPPSNAERSDRSAADRLRHRQKVREAIRDNVADIVAEESIIGQSRDRVIKVPIKGVKEYRFVYGDNKGGVAQGQGNTQQGDVVGQAGQQAGQAGQQGGDQPGQDYYETDITLEELIEIMFEDLALPDMERKILRTIDAERSSKRKGYRAQGIRVRLDKKRSVKNKLKRQITTKQGQNKQGQSKEAYGLDHKPENSSQTLTDSRERFRFHPKDLTYRYITSEPKPQSNAVVICIMDTSGSMDTSKKYLARSIFFLLYQFVNTRYENVDVVFIAHHSRAQEVSEEDFFHKGESGGTLISSGYLKALDIIEDRYHSSLWNIYAFHASDGDNFVSDNEAALKSAQELCKLCNLFGYGEIKPTSTYSTYENSLFPLFDQIDANNFQSVLISSKEDIWPSFKSLLAKEVSD
jgi:sporulation protein YhbH